MDRDGRVGEERRGPHRRDREPAAALGERVDDPVEHVVLLDVLDLEVGDRRLVVRAPVDDPVRPVDPAALPETYEERHHGADVLVVHGEPLARVVDRRAEPPVLAHDRPARLLEPVPGPRDERLAADLAARGALRDELLLDDVLRRDAGVVVAGLPERVEPPHPVPADQDVLHRAVQRVAHVELARDVRRRDADHEGVVAATACAGGVEALRFPGLLPAPLDARGVVQALHQDAECTERVRARGRGSCWWRARAGGPRASSARASVVTTVRPRWTIVPMQRTSPVSAVIARVKFAFSSSVVQRVPASAIETNAVPIAESSSVVAKPGVHGADRVVEVLARLGLPHDAAALDLDDAHRDRVGHRRVGDLAGDHPAQRLEAVHAGHPRDHVVRVVPGRRARARLRHGGASSRCRRRRRRARPAPGG